MAESPGTHFIRRQLGRSLREAREARDLSLDQVASARGMPSKAKLSRIENGKTSVSMGDVLALCRHYGVGEDRTAELSELAPGTKVGGAGWSERFGDLVVPDWFGVYVDLEFNAAEIHTYHPVTVHGLLQTEHYARALIAMDERLEPDVVDQRVEFRMQRQQRVLHRDPVPKLTVIHGAAALARIVGSPDVMAAQIEHMRTLARSGIATIRVLPWDAAYPTQGPFTLLEFEDPTQDPPVAVTEMPMGAAYEEKATQIEEYRYVWGVLKDRSVPIEEYTP